MEKRQYFIGTAGEMRFFTPVPLEAHNMGGIYHWRVLAGADEAGQLVLGLDKPGTSTGSGTRKGWKSGR